MIFSVSANVNSKREFTKLRHTEYEIGTERYSLTADFSKQRCLIAVCKPSCILFPVHDTLRNNTEDLAAGDHNGTVVKLTESLHGSADDRGSTGKLGSRFYSVNSRNSGTDKGFGIEQIPCGTSRNGKLGEYSELNAEINALIKQAYNAVSVICRIRHLH